MTTTELIFYQDDQRHLVCVPYSIENLHRMADVLGVKRHFYHASPYPHYDVPKTMAPLPSVTIVRPREIIKICKTCIL